MPLPDLSSIHQDPIPLLQDGRRTLTLMNNECELNLPQAWHVSSPDASEKRSHMSIVMAKSRCFLPSLSCTIIALISMQSFRLYVFDCICPDVIPLSIELSGMSEAIPFRAFVHYAYPRTGWITLRYEESHLKSRLLNPSYRASYSPFSGSTILHSCCRAFVVRSTSISNCYPTKIDIHATDRTARDRLNQSPSSCGIYHNKVRITEPGFATCW